MGVRLLIVLVLAFSHLFGQGPLPRWSYTVRDSLPHPVERFTQGLFWDGEHLVESTGLHGHSQIFRMDRSGGLQAHARLAPAHFGEGSARLGPHIVWLTWQSKVAFILDPYSLQRLDSLPLPGEGWGLSNCNGALWMSDGTDRLFVVDVARKKVKNHMRVRVQGRPLVKLNELECVGNYVLANVWQSDSVAVIRTTNGVVEAWIDLAPLARRALSQYRNSEVTNGLAWDGNYLWITGKLWPWIWALDIPQLRE